MNFLIRYKYQTAHFAKKYTEDDADIRNKLTEIAKKFNEKHPGEDQIRIIPSEFEDFKEFEKALNRARLNVVLDGAIQVVYQPKFTKDISRYMWNIVNLDYLNEVSKMATDAGFKSDELPYSTPGLDFVEYYRRSAIL